ncbi:MAG: rhomboid protease GluP, partial [Myxococcota bacterium]
GFAGGPTRPPVVVVAIAVILVAIHSISVLLDLTGTYDLVRLGAYMQALVLKGEYWRAFSSMFLHGGFIHLAFNVAMLLYLGLSLGRFLRQPAILLLYLLSGLVGSAAVGIFAEASLMVGASGAVFGLMGALLVGVRIRPDALPGNVAKRMESMLVVLLVANLGLGAWVEFIALSAHVGGALAGAAIGWVMLQGPTLTTSVPRSIGPIGLVVTVTLYIGFSAWSVMGVSRAMALPISELIPLVTRTYTIAEVGLGRANIELQVPSTWLRLSDLVTGPDAEEARKQEAKDGPVLLDGSGGLQRTDVACRLRPEGFDLAAPRSGDAVALAAQLREHNSGDFEPGPAGFAVLQRTRGDETLIFAVGLFPKGRLDLKFAFVLKPTDARELVDSLLPHAKLTACIRTRTEPSDRTTD